MGDPEGLPEMLPALNVAGRFACKAKGLSFLWFQVHRHIFQRQLRSQQLVLHFMRDTVTLTDGEVALHPDMKIGDVGEPAFANATLLGAQDTGNRAGGEHDGLFGLIGDLGIHDIPEGEAEHGVRAVEDDDAGEEGRPVVGDLVALATHEADGDTDEGGDRGDGVGAVVPGVCEKSIATDSAGLPRHELEENLLEHDHNDQQEECPGGGEMNLCAVGGGDELGNAVVGDEGTRDRQDESPDDGCKGFGFPVAVGVVGVGGFGGILEGPPDEQGAEEIEQGLDAVCDQGIGATDETTGDLPGRKDKV